MRRWFAVSTMITKYRKDKVWDKEYVSRKLGHKTVDTTKTHYLGKVEDKYEEFKCDWFRAALKFHPHSRKMKKVMKQYNRPNQKEENYQTMNQGGSIVNSTSVDKIRTCRDSNPSYRLRRPVGYPNYLTGPL